MKLLLYTQAVNSQDPILGFMHGWLSEFAKHWESITVVCLFEGEHHLPANVSVLSLGKNEGRGRLTYLYRFFSYSFFSRVPYDAVFVHMNQEYVLLGGFFWRLLGKRVALWYNHAAGSFLTRLSAALAHHVFHTSPFAFVAGSSHARTMPAGIDTTLFREYSDIPRESNSVLSLGRIAPIKGLDVLVDGIKSLESRHIPLHARIVGDPAPRDKAYAEYLHHHASELVRAGVLEFLPGVPNTQTPALYAQHLVFVNLSPSGLYDKTILEAAACGTLPLVSSRAFVHDLPPECLFEEGRAADVAAKLEALFSLLPEQIHLVRQRVRQFVQDSHSLTALAREVHTALTS